MYKAWQGWGGGWVELNVSSREHGELSESELGHLD